MIIDIITLFPEAFSYFNYSIFKKAIEKKIIKVNFLNPRNFTSDKHQKVDDSPYGGGPGMVIKFEPVYKALEQAKKNSRFKKKIILTHPAGKIFDQKLARQLSLEKHLIIICGHYEGIDARIEKFIDLKISLGKYILTGGELAAMVIADTIIRYLPDVLHHPLSLEEKRTIAILSPNKKDPKEKKFKDYSELYSYPAYTRPEIIKINKKVLRVPKVLLSGNHQLIAEWRKKHSKKII
jgi:tRNA (guanine37-N1)-methyltransferase